MCGILKISEFGKSIHSLDDFYHLIALILNLYGHILKNRENKFGN